MADNDRRVYACGGEHRLTLRAGSATVALMIPGRQPLRALKDGTADLHQRAETYVRILDRDATVDDYARYLVAMHGFHAPLEAAFARDPALEAAGFAAATRRRAHLIHRDLSALATPSASDTRPCCAALPVRYSLAHQIGIAYVIEGSTLGGKFILSRLPPALAGLRGTATAFLEGYGSATAAQWRAFASVVERALTADDEVAAVEGARAAFACLIDWLAGFEAPDAARVAS